MSDIIEKSLVHRGIKATHSDSPGQEGLDLHPSSQEGPDQKKLENPSDPNASLYSDGGQRAFSLLVKSFLVNYSFQLMPLLAC